MAVVAAMIAVGALGLPWWAPVLLALGATAGALRACDPPPGLGVALSTPAGVVHTGLVLKLVLGVDLALVAAAAMLIADALAMGPIALVVGIALLVWQVIRSRD